MDEDLTPDEARERLAELMRDHLVRINVVRIERRADDRGWHRFAGHARFTVIVGMEGIYSGDYSAGCGIVAQWALDAPRGTFEWPLPGEVKSGVKSYMAKMYRSMTLHEEEAMLAALRAWEPDPVDVFCSVLFDVSFDETMTSQEWFSEAGMLPSENPERDLATYQELRQARLSLRRALTEPVLEEMIQVTRMM